MRILFIAFVSIRVKIQLIYFCNLFNVSQGFVATSFIWYAMSDSLSCYRIAFFQRNLPSSKTSQVYYENVGLQWQLIALENQNLKIFERISNLTVRLTSFRPSLQCLVFNQGYAREGGRVEQMCLPSEFLLTYRVND